MVLSRSEILTYIQDGRLRFTPAVPSERIAQVSIDLLLGRKFTTFKKEPPAYISAIHVDPSLWESADLWDFYEGERFRLEPGQFVLAQTLEEVTIPNDLVGLVEGRSSFARIGVTVHVTAPKIDPGFQGHVTLEMTNFGSMAVELRAELDQPAQLMLIRLTSPIASPDLYGAGENDIFQYQNDPIPRGKKRS